MLGRISSSIKDGAKGLATFTYDTAKFAIQHPRQAVALGLTYAFSVAEATLREQNDVAATLSTNEVEKTVPNYFFSKSMYVWHQMQRYNSQNLLSDNVVFVLSGVCLSGIGLCIGSAVWMENKRKQRQLELRRHSIVSAREEQKTIEERLKVEKQEELERKAIIASQRETFFKRRGQSTIAETHSNISEKMGKVSGKIKEPKNQLVLNSGNKEKAIEKLRRKSAEQERKDSAKQATQAHAQQRKKSKALSKKERGRDAPSMQSSWQLNIASFTRFLRPQPLVIIDDQKNQKSKKF